MRQISKYFLFVFVIIGLYGFTLTSSADMPGKKVFVDKKCGSCHTVTSAGLTSTNKKATDISKVGATHKADFLVKYLNKQEKINGKNHAANFKGTEQEAKDLAAWLETLKK